MLGKNTMQFLGSSFIGFSGVIFGLKQSKMIARPVHFDGCAPLLRVIVPRNPLVSRSVRLYAGNVPHILRFRGKSKVFPSVIRRVFIDMVYLLVRPLSRLHCPYNSMGLVQSTVYPNQNSIFASFAPSKLTRFSPTSGVNLPYQMAGLRVILQQEMNLFRFYHKENLPRSEADGKGKF